LLFIKYDSPTFSLYRLFDSIASDDGNAITTEMQYFWDGPHDRWKLEDIPDLPDPDEQRYAIMASIVESLVLSFNWRRGLGARRNRSCSSAEDDGPECCPGWAEKVPSLAERLNLCKEEEDIFTEFILGKNDDVFSKRNIKANGEYLFNIQHADQSEGRHRMLETALRSTWGSGAEGSSAHLAHTIRARREASRWSCHDVHTIAIDVRSP
jgi:hypothetical protein